MNQRNLTVGEIEHEGDVDDAIENLTKAGFRNVTFLSANYDEEVAYFRVDVINQEEYVALYDKAQELGVCF